MAGVVSLGEGEPVIGCVGVGTPGGEVAGATGDDIGLSRPIVEEKFCLLERMARLREVSMKIVAAMAVILLRKVPAPLDPKTV